MKIIVTILILISSLDAFSKEFEFSTQPVTETYEVESSGDSADDPAFWFNEKNPAESRVFGTDKNAGIFSYNLRGEVVQFIEAGGINNIDLRGYYKIGKEKFSILAGSNTDFNSIDLFLISEDGNLVPFANNSVDTDLKAIYGLCMFKNYKNKKTYIFVSDQESLTINQFELSLLMPVTIKPVRVINIGSVSEGCVVDDFKSSLYYSQEDSGSGIFKITADPLEPLQIIQIDSVDNGHIVGDAEGLSFISTGQGPLLIASSQGSSDFTVYSGDFPHDYLGRFSISSNDDIDSVSKTDGIEAVVANLPAPFENGIFITQDDENTSSSGKKINQNFKFTPLKPILDNMLSRIKKDNQ